MQGRIFIAALAFALIGVGTSVAAPEDSESALSGWPEYDPAVEGYPTVDETPSAAAPPFPWTLRFGVYGWMARMDGESVIDGRKRDIDVSFSEIAENLESGLFAYAEVRYEGWFVSFDGMWGTLGNETRRKNVTVELEVDQRRFDLSIGRELLRRERGGPTAEDPDAWPRTLVLDLFVGARYWDERVRVKTTVGALPPIDLELNQDRWDPLIGLCFRTDVARRWRLGLEADVGGFGIGDAARIAWNFEAKIGYRASRSFTVFAGWRALGFDTTEGRGNDRNGMKLLQHGPIIGAGFEF